MIQRTLAKLVSFKTVSRDHKANRACLAWIKKELASLPIRIREINVNDFPALVAGTKSLKPPKILLQGHIDVVDGPAELFKLRSQGKKLIGRGVFDMKFAVAAYIELFKTIGQKLKDYDLGLMITTDEELGGKNGVGALVAQGYKPKVCVLPDGGENWTFQEAAKGIYQIRLKSHGKSGHGSRPWTGTNAIEQLSEFIRTFQQEFASEPCGTNDHDHATLNVGRIIGGAEVNKIPDYAEADLDIRFVNDADENRIKRTINQLKKKFSAIRVDVLSRAAAYQVDKRNFYLRSFVRIVERRLKRKVEFIRSHGSSDARYFASERIPVILLRPVGGGHHSSHEWIDLPSLKAFLLVLKEFVETNANLTEK